MKKTLKIHVITALILMLIGLSIFTAIYFTVGSELRYKGLTIDNTLYNESKELSEKETIQDKKEIIKTLEKSHPYFVINGKTETYNNAKNNFLNASIKTAEDLNFAIAELLTVFEDLHTESYLLDQKEVFGLTINAYYDFEVNKIISRGYKDIVQEGSEVISINGVPMNTIIENSKKYFSYENKYSLVFSLNQLFISPNILAKCGVIINEDNVVKFYLNGITYERNFKKYTHEEWRILNGEMNNGEVDIEATKSISVSIKDDVLLINYRRCADEGNLTPALNIIKKAMEDGIKKVIVDVSKNGGGNSGVGSSILRELGLSFSRQEHMTKFSKLTNKNYGTMRTFGTKTQKFQYNSANKFDIQLRVITSNFTASAAIDFTSQVKFSDLGKIVGQPSGQNPNFSGNITSNQLKNSKIGVIIPISNNTWYYKDAKVDNILDVDIKVPYGANAMDYITFD